MKNERNSKDRVKKKLIVENCIENKKRQYCITIRHSIQLTTR